MSGAKRTASDIGSLEIGLHLGEIRPEQMRPGSGVPSAPGRLETAPFVRSERPVQMGASARRPFRCGRSGGGRRDGGAGATARRLRVKPLATRGMLLDKLTRSRAPRFRPGR